MGSAEGSCPFARKFKRALRRFNLRLFGGGAYRWDVRKGFPAQEFRASRPNGVCSPDASGSPVRLGSLRVSLSSHFYPFGDGACRWEVRKGFPAREFRASRPSGECLKVPPLCPGPAGVPQLSILPPSLPGCAEGLGPSAGSLRVYLRTHFSPFLVGASEMAKPGYASGDRNHPFRRT